MGNRSATSATASGPNHWVELSIRRLRRVDCERWHDAMDEAFLDLELKAKSTTNGL